DNDSSGSTEYTLWDPYPDRDASSDWAKAIDACAADIGITIKRNAGNTGDTVKDLTTAAAGKLPDIAMVDNPKVSTLADAGLLTTTDDNGLDVSDIQENILTAGQIDGKTYGVPVGANTLGLYYNPAVLEAAGVDIASVTGGASLTAALEKVVASGKRASPSRPSAPKRARSSSFRGSGVRAPTSPRSTRARRSRRLPSGPTG